jgi:Tol biopolymer transport system component
LDPECPHRPDDGERLAANVDGSSSWVAAAPFLAYSSARDIYTIPAAGGSPAPLLKTPFSELHPQISPNGKWLAFTSDESGQNQILVMPLTGNPPSPAQRIPISINGGSHPRWSRDGGELFLYGYDVSPDGRFLLNVPSPDSSPISVILNWSPVPVTP